MTALLLLLAVTAAGLHLKTDMKGAIMKRTLTLICALFVGALSTAAVGAPGEWWEVTAKMEMPGMPFAMPATTTKVCIAKGAVSDPHQSMQDKECKMTDI